MQRAARIVEISRQITNPDNQNSTEQLAEVLRIIGEELEAQRDLLSILANRAGLEFPELEAFYQERLPGNAEWLPQHRLNRAFALLEIMTGKTIPGAS